MALETLNNGIASIPKDSFYNNFPNGTTTIKQTTFDEELQVSKDTIEKLAIDVTKNVRFKKLDKYPLMRILENKHRQGMASTDQVIINWTNYSQGNEHVQPILINQLRLKNANLNDVGSSGEIGGKLVFQEACAYDQAETIDESSVTKLLEPISAMTEPVLRVGDNTLGAADGNGGYTLSAG